MNIEKNYFTHKKVDPGELKAIEDKKIIHDFERQSFELDPENLEGSHTRNEIR
ncbi:hypothetical protein Amet_2218 [Alkaliphilus metalliredigens QYMF]|uniref:Uncharacterized protein n=1 Tax=Alkaliphilus metalliredigens (strain QYMF) TaxID=293826 RepID=A6TQA8_ALKMQ|nr:hypothetical protein [Alkaliphilus metalliredigens]ABR48376.1 hypothetical protein Amet_2218 [Alkaliphilus metalliredigens QYMF]